MFPPLPVTAVDLGLPAREEVPDAADVRLVGVGSLSLIDHVELQGGHRRVTCVDLAVREHRVVRVDRIERADRGAGASTACAEHRREARHACCPRGAVVDRVEVLVHFSSTSGSARALGADRVGEGVTLGQQRSSWMSQLDIA